MSMTRTAEMVYSILILPLLIYLAHSSENITESVLLKNNSETNSVTDILSGKHESLKGCITTTLNESEYVLFENGTLYIEPYNLSLNESLYILQNGTATICYPFKEEHTVLKGYVTVTSYLTLAGLGISMVCLLAHLVVFSITPELRNLPGWNLATLCVSLLISYMLLFLISTDHVLNDRNACIALASLTHFFLLASFLWMSVMSFDVFSSLARGTRTLQVSKTQFNLKKFGIYCLCAFGIALFFALLGLFAEVLDIFPKYYRPGFGKVCWFSDKTPLLVFFAGPVITLICLNFIFFALSAYILHANKRRSNEVDPHNTLRLNYLMYFRLSVIMGVTWIVGIIATIANVEWMWCIFVLVNSLQGLYIFLAFTWSKKVKTYFWKKLLSTRRAPV